MNINKRRFGPTVLLNNKSYTAKTKEEIHNNKNLEEIMLKLKSIAEKLAFRDSFKTQEKTPMVEFGL